MPADPALVPWAPDPALAPPPDRAAEPAGYLVEAAPGLRLHFAAWSGPSGPGGGPPAPSRDPGAAGGPGVLLVPGLLQPASSWAPVARRLAGVRAVAVADLRGQGLSDAPADGYDVATLAADLALVAEAAGLGAPLVVAGHGHGGALAAELAARLGDACAGLVLVDGGWERAEAATGLDVEEFLRGLDEPPEVLRTLDAFLADRRAFDPATWDADQERAARDAVVETAAGHVVRAVRPHVVEALVRGMFAADPGATLARVAAPVTVLVATGGPDPAARLGELARAGEARAAAGGSPPRVARLGGGHNLMRYRPAEVAAAILAAG